MKQVFNCLYILLCASPLLLSCGKTKEIKWSEEGKIYMTQAQDSRSNLTAVIADAEQTFSFGASYGGLEYPSQDITVNFELATDLVDDYNAANGTSYQIMPTDKYTISGLTTVIPAGRTTSEGLTVSIKTKDLEKDAEYLFPIVLKSVSSGNINPDLSTAWFRVKIVRKETDVTDTGTLTVSKDNDGGPNAGEGSSKLIDNNLNSKFLVFNFPSGLWMQLQLSAPQVIEQYKLTSGNDAPERDPKNWKFFGSTNGTDWTLLDEKTDQSFSGRNQTINYEFDNDTPYSYYRWQVDEINGADLFQISEWRIVTFK
ncbi:BT_3987 domain-containing protein [Ferruginibacter sp.]